MTKQSQNSPTFSVGEFQTTAAAAEPTASSASIRFADACSKVEADRLREGIGTLGEKTLHAVLKHYYQPDPTYHEQKIGSYFADIAKEGEIIEIQTRDLSRLKTKLHYFIEEGYAITVVHPLPRHRWIYWIGEDGTLSERRKSPKIGKPYHALPELSGLGDLLFHPHLMVILLLLDVEDFRNLDGWSKDKKKGSSRYERMPVAYGEEILLNRPADLYPLLPPKLPKRFSAAQFNKAGGFKGRNAYYALKLLERSGIISQVGQEGKKYIYAVNEPGL